MAQTRKHASKSTKDRLEEKFRVTPGCWIWQAARFELGYGQMKVDGKIERAHRISYEIYVGPIPLGMSICHRCDNPSCVNPDHLFVGDQLANMQDRKSKGRNKAKITLAQAKSILLDQRRYRAIAEQYGISESHVSNIKLGIKWPELQSQGQA